MLICRAEINFMPACTMPAPFSALISISALNKTLTISLKSIEKKLSSHLADFVRYGHGGSLGESVNSGKFATKIIFQIRLNEVLKIVNGRFI